MNDAEEVKVMRETLTSAQTRGSELMMENQRLKAEARTIAATGRLKERLAIVEWLRGVFALNQNAQLFANAIQEGEHLKP